jgi:uncharacterized membrane protein YfcA
MYSRAKFRFVNSKIAGTLKYAHYSSSSSNDGVGWIKRPLPSAGLDHYTHIVEFNTLAIVVICCAAVLIGLSRTAIPGFGTFVPIFIALVMPVRESTGFLLPILAMADIMAVIYWRRIAVWRRLLGILPWALIGIVVGYFLMSILSEAIFKPLLGGMIVLFVVLDLVRRWTGFVIKTENRTFIMVSGILAGAFTMMANAAGPIMTIYLLSMNLRKEDFVGTNAWFFMILNLLKLPFSFALGLLTWPHLKIDFAMAPLIVLGELAGIFIVKKIPQKTFDTLAQILAAVAGIKLFFS